MFKYRRRIPDASSSEEVAFSRKPWGTFLPPRFEPSVPGDVIHLKQVLADVDWLVLQVL